ncbi:MAG: hypothetical protein KAR20_03090, partial [Candidatus Heimdallarchaeota archaeon]|nr:hypothetical protein [Candidatus Heimdallarchaeota archaeon]
ERRYSLGGNSGRGSNGELLNYKARIINEYIARTNVQSIIDFGCGDGKVAQKIQIENYMGFDISGYAITMCRKRMFLDLCKTFFLTKAYCGEVAEMTLSLDVIFHLVDDETFKQYMGRLFEAAGKYVLIYSSNSIDSKTAEHVKHRIFTNWIKENCPGWRLFDFKKNEYPYTGDETKGSFSDFYFYERRNVT